MKQAFKGVEEKLRYDLVKSNFWLRKIEIAVE